VSENLLAGFQKTPSFAIYDGESANVRFTGKLDPSFTKEDKNGIIHEYLGIEVFLISHSNEMYKHRHESVLMLRTGRTSTLAKWANDPEGGIKSVNPDIVFKAFNSAKLGFDLRVESMK